MYKILIQKGNEKDKIEISEGVNLYSELAKKKLIDAAPCGGKGTCGKCKVEIIENCPEPTEEDFEYLSQYEIDKGIRLACEINVKSDMVVNLPNHSDGFGGITIIDDLVKPKEAYFALDIGTTTLEGVLIDAETNKQIVKMIKLNPQKAFGADVFTRLNFSLESDEKRMLLKETIIVAVNNILETLCDYVGIIPNAVSKIVISANTTMIHMLLGEKVDKLAFAPFITDFLAPKDLKGKELSLLCEKANIHISPASSSFVGGDITSGAVSLDLDKETHITLFIDLGTNGEMIFINEGNFVGCSVAAGPAFEGAEIACGMSALSGAVSKASIKKDIEFETIDDVKPKGICGSGLIDMMASLLKAGLIDSTGKLATECENKALNARLKKVNGIDSFIIYEDSGNFVYLNQKDIRNFQLAKAAIKTGIEMLLEKENTKPIDIGAVYIAGGFGSHLSSENLYNCGLLPFLHDNIKIVGNTSLKGSVLSVSNESIKKRILDFSKKVDVFLLSSHRDFQNLFVDNMMFE